MKKNRNRTVDIAKAIAIYLVVLGHIQLIGDSISMKLIATVHMPAFFFLSGLFFEKSFQKYSFKEFIYNKCKTLLVPYLLWSGVALVVNLALLLLSGEHDKVLSEIYDVYINARSLWFLMVLFLTSLIVWIIRKLSFDNWYLFYALSVVLWIGLLLVGRIAVFSFYKFQWLFPYYIVAILCANQINVLEIIDNLEKRKILIKCTCSAVALLVYAAGVVVFVDDALFNDFLAYFTLSGKNYLGYFICYVLGLIGIWAIIELSSLISGISKLAKPLSYVGKISLDIYVIHMFLVKAFLLLIDKIGINGFAISQVALVLYAFLIVAIIALAVKYILKKSSLYRFSLGEK